MTATNAGDCRVLRICHVVVRASSDVTGPVYLRPLTSSPRRIARCRLGLGIIWDVYVDYQLYGT